MTVLKEGSKGTTWRVRGFFVLLGSPFSDAYEEVKNEFEKAVNLMTNRLWTPLWRTQCRFSKVPQRPFRRQSSPTSDAYLLHSQSLQDHFCDPHPGNPTVSNLAKI